MAQGGVIGVDSLSLPPTTRLSSAIAQAGRSVDDLERWLLGAAAMDSSSRQPAERTTDGSGGVEVYDAEGRDLLHLLERENAAAESLRADMKLWCK